MCWLEWCHDFSVSLLFHLAYRLYFEALLLILHFWSFVLSLALLFTLICFTCVLLTCLSSVHKPVFSFTFARSLLFLTCLHTRFFHQCIFQWISNVSQSFQSFALLVPAFLGFLPMTNGLTIGLTFPVKLLLFTFAIRSFELHQCWLHCLYLGPPLSGYLLECDRLNWPAWTQQTPDLSWRSLRRYASLLRECV